LRRYAFFTDYVGGLFGTFVLSRVDPQSLSRSLFPKGSAEMGGWRDHRESPMSGREQELSRRVAVLEQELRGIQASLVWRMREKVVHSRIGPPLASALILGKKSISWLVQNQQGFWKGKVPWLLRRSASQLPPVAGGTLSANKTVSASGRPGSSKAQYEAQEVKWLAEICARKPRVIAVCNPRWMGVTSSTKTLFEDVLLVEDTADEADQVRYANLLAEAECPRIVFSGLAPVCLQIIRRLHKMSSGTKIAILWHGNFLHCAENLDWNMFHAACELSRNGVVWKIGFVKKGMAEVIARAGINGAFVMNYVERVPERASTPLEGGPHIAVWSYPFMWRKYPYAMMASVLMIPHAKLHAHMVNARVKAFLDFFRVPLSSATNSWVPQDEMPEYLAQMHLNLYVTLSECAPMLPLESLSVGCPCLLGPTSHLFDDHEYLHKSLIVQYPDSARAIGLQAIKALEQREEIVEAYKKYAPEYNKRARKSVEDFIED
ncbi:MAG: hypothetical protein LDL33_14515, partial [Desulfomonile sp.]|nr:hypothetical protein [Desulfomonile sp.]